MFLVELITSYIFQVVMTVGAIMLFGWLIALCNRCFYANFGPAAMKVCYVTGFIGTPLHELSHALFCVIFRHRIIEMKLFQIGAEDGTLGYVQHSYNRRSVYQQIGNFFIGVAPILVISAILFVAAYFLMPDMMEGVRMLSTSAMTLNFKQMLFGLGKMLWAMVVSLKSPWTYLFLLISFFVALHMNLSGSDIRGAAKGMVFLLIALFIVDFILVLIGGGLLAGFTSYVALVGGYLLCMMILSLTLSIVMMSFSFIVRKFRMLKEGR